MPFYLTFWGAQNKLTSFALFGDFSQDVYLHITTKELIDTTIKIFICYLNHNHAKTYTFRLSNSVRYSGQQPFR